MAANRLLLILACAAALVFSGLVHGLWTNRWQNSQALEEALARVPLVPLAVGPWQGQALPVDPELYAKAGAEAYWMRRYDNAETGESISVILMCGRGGKMAVHTPDVCYKGAGYEQMGQDRKVSIPVAAGPAEFRTANFSKESSAGGHQLRLYWSWGAAGAWRAPDVPRLTFGGQPALYKLYVIRAFVPENESPDDDHAVLFLQDFLPQLDDGLFSHPAP